MTMYYIYIANIGGSTPVEADRINTTGDYIELYRDGALVAAFNKSHVTHLTTR